MQTLKFKAQHAICFYTAVNHYHTLSLSPITTQEHDLLNSVKQWTCFLRGQWYDWQQHNTFWMKHLQLLTRFTCYWKAQKCLPLIKQPESHPHIISRSLLNWDIFIAMKLLYILGITDKSLSYFVHVRKLSTLGWTLSNLKLQKKKNDY